MQLVHAGTLHVSQAKQPERTIHCVHKLVCETPKIIHLQDFNPELFTSKSEKELKKEALELYQEFKPEFFIDQLNQFLDQNITDFGK